MNLDIPLCFAPIKETDLSGEKYRNLSEYEFNGVEKLWVCLQLRERIFTLNCLCETYSLHRSVIAAWIMQLDNCEIKIQDGIISAVDNYGLDDIAEYVFTIPKDIKRDSIEVYMDGVSDAIENGIQSTRARRLDR